jgi:hypothetical protein
VLRPLLYSLITHDYVANSIIRFADDTTVIGLITNNNETAYREEVRPLADWCQKNKQNKGAFSAVECRESTIPSTSTRLQRRGSTTI